MNKFNQKFLDLIAIPKLGWLIVTLQGLGFLFSQMNPGASHALPLLPSAVLQGGEWWRIVTYLAVPITTSPLWLIFALWFLFFCTEILEREWGAGKFTLYFLLSWGITVLFSLLTGYPILSAQHTKTSLFLAVAALFPSLQVSIFFLFPIELRWLGWLSGGLVLWEFVQGTAYDRWLLIAIYSNFLAFFGPVLVTRVKDFLRKKRFSSKL